MSAEDVLDLVDVRTSRLVLHSGAKCKVLQPIRGIKRGSGLEVAVGQFWTPLEYVEQAARSCSPFEIFAGIPDMDAKWVVDLLEMGPIKYK
eukprot:6464942-Amphidinium_carterae.1